MSAYNEPMVPLDYGVALTDGENANTKALALGMRQGPWVAVTCRTAATLLLAGRSMRTDNGAAVSHGIGLHPINATNVTVGTGEVFAFLQGGSEQIVTQTQTGVAVEVAGLTFTSFIGSTSGFVGTLPAGPADARAAHTFPALTENQYYRLSFNASAQGNDFGVYQGDASFADVAQIGATVTAEETARDYEFEFQAGASVESICFDFQNPSPGGESVTFSDVKLERIDVI